MHLLKWVHHEQDVRGRDLDLRYFRDVDGRDVDFVVTDREAPIRLIEVKWSDRLVDKAAHSLPGYDGDPDQRHRNRRMPDPGRHPRAAGDPLPPGPRVAVRPEDPRLTASPSAPCVPTCQQVKC